MVSFAFCLYRVGRGGGIRTRDPLHPMQVRYQAALRPEQDKVYQFYSGFQAKKRALHTLSRLGSQG